MTDLITFGRSCMERTGSSPTLRAENVAVARKMCGQVGRGHERQQ